MRLNKFLAAGSPLSRRGADEAIAAGRVTVNGRTADQGMKISETDVVALDNRAITPPVKTLTIMLNKPRGYVVSRQGQGSQTIYDLLPPEYQHLNPVGRLDKDSSGLLLLTNDGDLAHELTHPSRQKLKVYEIMLDKPLAETDFAMITKKGVDIGDAKLSRFDLVASSEQQAVRNAAAESPYYFLPSTYYWRATLAEGRNRQIRRTFEALGYRIQTLHRTHFGQWKMNDLQPGNYREITVPDTP